MLVAGFLRDGCPGDVASAGAGWLLCSSGGIIGGNPFPLPEREVFFKTFPHYMLTWHDVSHAVVAPHPDARRTQDAYPVLCSHL